MLCNTYEVLWEYLPTRNPPRWLCSVAQHSAVQHNRTFCTFRFLSDENPLETHKKHRLEALEVPNDLQDMEIPLKDMGDVVVLT